MLPAFWACPTVIFKPPKQLLKDMKADGNIKCHFKYFRSPCTAMTI